MRLGPRTVVPANVTVVPALSLLKFKVSLPGTVMSLRTMFVQLAVADGTAVYAVTVHAETVGEGEGCLPITPSAVPS
jgi:hypothetical protein